MQSNSTFEFGAVCLGAVGNTASWRREKPDLATRNRWHPMVIAVGEFAKSRNDPIYGRDNVTLRSLYQENGAQEDAVLYDAPRTMNRTIMGMLNTVVYDITYGELAAKIAAEDYS